MLTIIYSYFAVFRREYDPSLKSSHKNKGSDGDDKPLKPKSVRHVILIRHGQYNTNGSTDKERYLTPLGELF